METYDLVDALQAHQGQRHSKSSRQTSETSLIRDKPHYGIFYFRITLGCICNGGLQNYSKHERTVFRELL